MRFECKRFILITHCFTILNLRETDKTIAEAFAAFEDLHFLSIKKKKQVELKNLPFFIP